MCFGVGSSLSPEVEGSVPEVFHAPDGTPTSVSRGEAPGAQGKSHDHSPGPTILTYGQGHPLVPVITLSQPSGTLLTV